MEVHDVCCQNLPTTKRFVVFYRNTFGSRAQLMHIVITLRNRHPPWLPRDATGHGYQDIHTEVQNAVASEMDMIEK